MNPRERFIHSADRRLRVLEWGNHAGPTLLCLHGGSACAAWWHFFAQALPPDYRIAALDLRGHGASEHAADGDYSLDAYAADVATAAEQLELERCTLIGHSLGGFVALAAVPRIEPRLHALVLVDSRGSVGARSARYLRTLARFPHPTYPTLEDARSSFQLLPRATTARRSVLDHIAERSFVQLPDGSWTLRFDRRALGGLAVRSFTEDLRNFHRPTLLIRGEHSTALSRQALGELQREIPNSRMVEIAGAHHHVLLDRPTDLADAVVAFLRSLDVRPDERTIQPA